MRVFVRGAAHGRVASRARRRDRAVLTRGAVPVFVDGAPSPVRPPVEVRRLDDVALGDVLPRVKLSGVVQRVALFREIHHVPVVPVFIGRDRRRGQHDVPVGILEVDLHVLDPGAICIEPVDDEHAVDQVLLTEVDLHGLWNGTGARTLREIPSGTRGTFIAGVSDISIRRPVNQKRPNTIMMTRG